LRNAAVRELRASVFADGGVKWFAEREAGLNSLSRFFPSGLRPLRNVDGEVSLGGAL
jgi:hypothetical protein